MEGKLWKENSGIGGLILITLKENTLPWSPRGPISTTVLAPSTVTDSLYVTGKDRPGAPGLARNRKR